MTAERPYRQNFWRVVDSEGKPLLGDYETAMLSLLMDLREFELANNNCSNAVLAALQRIETLLQEQFPSEEQRRVKQEERDRSEREWQDRIMTELNAAPSDRSWWHSNGMLIVLLAVCVSVGALLGFALR